MRKSFSPLRFGSNAQRGQRLGERLGLQYHPLAAAKGAIVDSAVPVVGEGAQILHSDRNQPLGQRPAQYPVLEDAGKKAREDGDNLESHVILSRNIQNKLIWPRWSAATGSYPRAIA